MTLNVVVQNMVAVDSELSYQGARTSDDFEKSELFSNENYHGALLGNGGAFFLLDAISFIRGSPDERNLDQHMKNLEKNVVERKNKRYQDLINNLEEKIKIKYRLIADSEKREGITVREFADEVEKVYKEMEESSAHSSALYIVAYDKSQNMLRKYLITDRKRATFQEMDLIHVIADGSGGDLAGAYLTTHTSGINWDTIKPAYTFYLVTLACAAATANAGVGGFMRVATIDNKCVKHIDNQRVNAAVRVCSKQIAGNLSKKRAIQLVKNIYEGAADFEGIAQSLDITLNDLLYAPPRLHQDVAKFNLMASLKKSKLSEID